MRKIMIDRVVAIDIETTGLDPKRDKIIEIGAVRIKEGKIEKTYQSFVNPQRVISEFITELTGIRQEMLENAPKMEQVMKEFLEFAGEDCLLGHHVIFDFSFLKRNAVNLGYSFERKGIDTLKIARKFLNQLESKSLTALCQYYKIENLHAHRAREDAVAAFQLYQRLIDEFYTEEEEIRKIFLPQPLYYEVKKEGTVTKAQIKHLENLCKYHHITLEMEIKSLTKNEASRQIDFIISHYGKIQQQPSFPLTP